MIAPVSGTRGYNDSAPNKIAEADNEIRSLKKQLKKVKEDRHMSQGAKERKKKELENRIAKLEQQKLQLQMQPKNTSSQASGGQTADCFTKAEDTRQGAGIYSPQRSEGEKHSLPVHSNRKREPSAR